MNYTIAKKIKKSKVNKLIYKNLQINIFVDD